MVQSTTQPDSEIYIIRNLLKASFAANLWFCIPKQLMTLLELVGMFN